MTCPLEDGHPHAHSGIVWGYRLWRKAGAPVVLGEGLPRVVSLLGLTTQVPDWCSSVPSAEEGCERSKVSAPQSGPQNGCDCRIRASGATLPSGPLTLHADLRWGSLPGGGGPGALWTALFCGISREVFPVNPLGS